MSSLNVTQVCETAIPSHYESGKYCPPVHDTILCWPTTLANTTAYKLCKDLPNDGGVSVPPDNLTTTAYRVCLPNGQWEPLTNYSACLASLEFGDPQDTTEYVTQTMHQEISVQDTKILSVIYFVGSTVSLVVLLVALFIFQRFKSLQCPRTSIHKNLVVSFILRFLLHVILMEPIVFGHDVWYKSAEWQCRTLIALQLFTIVANFYWMLVEGLFLHLILVLRPLNNEKAPFLLFYFIGWVIPLLVTVSWAIVMHFHHDVSCWTSNSTTPYIFIIYAPIMLALFVNLLILMNLVRIVIAKLCSGHTTERQKIWRTIKSTAVLVLLLGIVNLLFFFRPYKDDSDARIVYRYVNAILPNCQGIFVSLIYCGMNAEVRRAIKKRWSRFKDARSMHSSVYRRRSSRTSMTMFASSTSQWNGGEQSTVMEMQALRGEKANGHGNLT